MGRESVCRRRNPPRSWKDATVHWLKEGDYYRIPWIRKFVPRLEAATGDAEILALKKELERFFSVMESGGELERDEVQDINRALLMGTLSIGESGVATTAEGVREPTPARRPRGGREPQGRDRGLREPTEQEIRDALRTPDDFGYGGELPIGETWSLGPVIRTRDSVIREQSNADALEAALENIREFQGEYEIVHAGHWAVGWVDHLAFHVVDENRQPTQIFKWILGWFDALESYPIADEEDFSRRKHEAAIKNIRDVGHRIQEGGPIEETGWEEPVREWLEENGSHNARRSLEDPENWGMEPEYVEEALRALGLFKAEEKYAIWLVPASDDPYKVKVYTEDRHAALGDQTIEGSEWKAPHNRNYAYATIDNAADLPDQLRAEGYIVDDSKWFWPPAGAPGQEELPRMHTLEEWQGRPSAHVLEIDLKWSLWSMDRETWEERAPEALDELERAWFTRLPLEIVSMPSKESRFGRVKLLPDQNKIEVWFIAEWDDPDTLIATMAGTQPLTPAQQDIILSSLKYAPSGSPGVEIHRDIDWPDRTAGVTFEQLLVWVDSVEDELIFKDQDTWEDLVRRVRSLEA